MIDEDFEKEKLMDAIEYEGFTTWKLIYAYEYEDYSSKPNVVEIQSSQTDYTDRHSHQELNNVLIFNKGDKVEVWGKFVKYIGWDEELVEIRYKKVGEENDTK